MLTLAAVTGAVIVSRHWVLVGVAVAAALVAVTILRDRRWPR